MEVYLYLLVATAYALTGAVLGVVYYVSPRLREERAFHLVTLLVMLLASLVVLLGASRDFASLAAFHRGAQFFLFIGASLFHVPVLVYLILHYWELVLEKITSPGSRTEPPAPPRTQRQHWEEIQKNLDTLTSDPTNAGAHERLGDVYAGMGFADSAAYQYRKAAEWLDRGYAQAKLLYKAAWVLVERKRDIPSALPVLRRIVRLYPKSFFAAYARRIINHYEARSGWSEGGAAPSAGPFQSFPPEAVD